MKVIIANIRLMKKYILAISVLMIFATPNLFSKEVTTQAAKTVAENFLNERNPNTMTYQLSNPIIKNNAGTPIYYVFTFKNGFIIVSADNSVFPVLGYSFESNYDESFIPAAFTYWMNQVTEQIYRNIKMEAKASGNIPQIWSKYLSGDFISSKLEENIDPLIASAWNQGCYYNSAFPSDTTVGQCGHPYAGCVAVAMGQIMKYYNWPETGKSENTISSPYGDLTANFGNTTYNWAGMENSLTDENPAVAELLYHSAIAVNSVFYPQGTGAYDYNIPPALANYFGYKETVQFILRDTYWGDWEKLIRIELENGRPVIYGGIDIVQEAGHTFICDGYQDNSFFHFNWGWGGAFNGYYYLDSLIVGGYHFDFQHDVVIGIEPDINGVIELYPPENLSATVDKHNVVLNWEHSSINSSLKFIGYTIFRNDTLLSEMVTTGLTFIDSNVFSGSHEYKVQSVFIGEGNGPSTSVEAYISGISNQVLESFVIYPNPAKNVIYISASAEGLKLEKIELYELSGKKIFGKNISSMINGRTKISLPNYLNGIYLLRLTNEKSTITKKLLIDSK